jgi:hypothetical protein
MGVSVVAVNRERERIRMPSLKDEHSGKINTIFFTT